MNSKQTIETFLNSQNLNQHYKFVTEAVKKRTGINIDRYPGMERQFQKMAIVLANKKQGQQVQLSTLNTDLQNHCTNYFCNKLLAKKQSGNNNNNNVNNNNIISNVNNNIISNINNGNNNVNNNNIISNVNNGNNGNIISNVNNGNNGNNMSNNMPSVLPTPDRPSLQTLRNDNMSRDYDNLLNQRAMDMKHSATGPNDFDPRNMIASRQDINEHDNSALTKALENALLERGQINTENVNADVLPNSAQPNVLPFNLNDDIANMLSSTNPGEDLPLYQNVIELNDETDPMHKLELLERERNDNENNNEQQTLESTTKILDYRKMDIEGQQKMAQKFMTRRGENNIVSLRNNTDAQTRNQQTEIKDAAELYRVNEEGKQRMIDRMTNSSISGNDVRSLVPLVDNLLLEKLVSLQKNMQPDYIEKVNYVIINSIDRDWYNTNETRYNFRVNFRPNSTYKGAGIQDLFRNIISIELVNSILPQDNVLIPFDARVYLDILHFPYLLLQIPEFSDVFRGTNNNNDRAFSVLIFDKQHDSSVLSNDFISGSTDSIVNGTPKNQFYKEYRKTFYKYTPAYFEKKTYYNQPLASLGHMTLKLATPAGENINVLNDVLTISNIEYTDTLNTLEGTEASNFEYDVSHGFPGENMSNHRYIRIETTTAFSNKLFRLGDNIRIQGYNIYGPGSKNADFIKFINREEGHYILNTDLTDLSNNNGANQGFVSNLYIAPPGELNSTLSALKSGSYYDDNNGTDINTSNYSTNSNVAKLINGNLQTHFLFKINTREGDVARVTMPINV